MLCFLRYFLLFTLLCFTNTIYAQFSGAGTGTEEDPYIVTDVYELQEMQLDYEAHYALGNDIDASETVTWNDGKGFKPVGDPENSGRFRGTLDGRGHTITGLYINRPEENRVGLISYLTQHFIFHDDGSLTRIRGTVKNLALEDASIRGNYTVGTIAGSSTSDIEQCYATGQVHGLSNEVGGIVGENGGNSVLANCYAAVEVSGDGIRIGGLTGSNEGEVMFSYAVGEVRGITTVKGGAVGRVYAPGEEPESTYWNVEITGTEDSFQGASGLVTAEMLQDSSFIEWDFDSVWTIDNGSTYPYLAWQSEIKNHNRPPETIAPTNVQGTLEEDTITINWQAPSMQEHVIGYNLYRDSVLIQTQLTDTTYQDIDFNGDHDPSYYVTTAYEGLAEEESAPSREVNVFMGFAGGDGTEEQPYQIATVRQLQAIENELSAHYEIINDIDATETRTWNMETGFASMGTFTGTLEGNGYKVHDLYMNRNLYGVGLFKLDDNARVANLHMRDVEITGDRNTGGIAYSQSGGLITGCSVTGTVSGGDYTAGIVGYMNGGSVRNSYSEATIHGNRSVGGIAGVAANDRVSYCYSISHVEGVSSVGGVVGNGTATACYAMGTVKGEKYVGGLVGLMLSPVTNSYALNRVNAQSVYAGNLAGFSSYDQQIYESYWNMETVSLEKGMESTKDSLGLGYRTTEMLQEASFEAWDFEEIWSINEGQTYPYFQWQEDSIHNVPIVSLAPTVLSAVPDSAGARLNWQAPSIDNMLAGYRIYRDEELLNTDSLITDTVFIDEEVGEQTVSYYITAVYAVDGEEQESHPSNMAGVSLEFDGGDGTSADPYQIASVDQLNNVRYLKDKHFIIVNDIDASETVNWNEGMGFEPIGTSDSLPFKGTLDGQGYEINGLTINRPEERSVGLFSGLGLNGSLSDVKLTAIDIKGGSTTGGITAHNSGVISGCMVAGSIEGASDLGGIAGRHEDGYIEHCVFEGDIQGSGSYVGGLVGENSADIAYSHVNTNVFGERSAGGVVGRNYGDALISYCYANGVVEAQGNAGGLVGELRAGKISNTYATNEVHGISGVGGLVGYIYSDVTIEYSYAAGNILLTEASEYERLGGFIGRGGHESSTELTANYWNVDSSGQELAFGSEDQLNGVTGLNNLGMRQQASFENWDFDNTWEILPEDGNLRSYPYLRNTKQNPEPGLLAADELPMSVEEHTNTTIDVYPVPAKDFLVVDLSSWQQRDYELTFTSTRGEVVDRRTVTGGRLHRLSLRHLKTANYIMQLKGGNQFMSKKIIMFK